MTSRRAGPHEANHDEPEHVRPEPPRLPPRAGCVRRPAEPRVAGPRGTARTRTGTRHDRRRACRCGPRSSASPMGATTSGGSRRARGRTTQLNETFAPMEDAEGAVPGHHRAGPRRGQRLGRRPRRPRPVRGVVPDRLPRLEDEGGEAPARHLGRSDRRPAGRPPDPDRLAAARDRGRPAVRVVRHRLRLRLPVQPVVGVRDAAAAAGAEPAGRVRAALRRRGQGRRGRRQGPHRAAQERPRLRPRGRQGPDPRPRPDRPAEGRRVPGRGPPDRGADPEVRAVPRPGAGQGRSRPPASRTTTRNTSP